MSRTRRAFLGAAAAIALAGCTEGDGNGAGNGDPSPTATATETGASPTPTDGEGGGATVQVYEHPDHGEILVGPDELTLYMFDQDTQDEGASSCYDSCAENWPPLTVEDEPTAGDGVEAELETFEREGGEMQVAANGWPLYYFAPDEEPGDAEGQGVGGAWWVLTPDGTPVREESTPTETENGGGGGY